MHLFSRPIQLSLAAFSVIYSASLLGSSDTWSQFRGTDGRSVALEQKIPDTFGPEDNVRWKTELPTGHSSPVVWGDRIFLTGYSDLKLLMFCLNASDGSILWKKERAIDALQRYAHKDSSPSAPTPCTDGNRVAFLFGDYGLIVTDMDGKEVWEMKFLPASSDFGYGASPVLEDGKLFINCDGGMRSGLLCLDFATGKELWHVERPGNMTSYSTPYIWKHGGKVEVLQAGSSRLNSYALEDGSPLWQVGNLPGFVCPTPVGNEERVFFGAWATAHVVGSNLIESLFPESEQLTPEELSDPKALFARYDTNSDGKFSREELPPSRALDAFNFGDRNQDDFWDFDEFSPLFSTEPRRGMSGRNVLVSIAAGGRGDITETHVRWETRKALPYVASPLLYQNRLYYVKKGGYISCVNPDSGEPYFEPEKLGVSGEYYASPIGVDGKVLVASQGGVITLLRASDEYEVIKKIEMNEPIVSSPAIAGKTLYVRTENNLWAFADSESGG